MNFPQSVLRKKRSKGKNRGTPFAGFPLSSVETSQVQLLQFTFLTSSIDLFAEIPVHIVNQRLLHVGGIRIIIIQNQFIQPIAGLPFHIVEEFQFKTIAVRVKQFCFIIH